MAKAKKLPSGNWRVQASVTISGKKVVQSFTAETAAKAEYAAEEWQEYYREIERDSSALTVDAAINEYISIKENILSPSTVRGYRIIQRNYIADISDIRLNKLTYRIVQKWVNDLSSHLAPKTVLSAYGLIASILRVFAPKVDIGKITLPQKKKAHNVALSKQETALLLNGIQGHPLEIPILLALWLGMRRSEITALQWEDIDFNKGIISINKALVPAVNGFALKAPKTTDSERVLKMPVYIAAKLKPLQKETGRIFDMEPNKCTKVFPQICEQIGIPKYRFHDLRHSMATIGVTLNIADKLVMARGGWNNIKTMKNIYQAVLSEDADMANNLYDSYFQSLIFENNSHENSHDEKQNQ